jgi:hypothetical protein
MLSSLILLVAINTWHRPHECVVLADNARNISAAYARGVEYMTLYETISTATVTIRSKDIGLHALWEVYRSKIDKPDLAWSILFNECMGNDNGI